MDKCLTKTCTNTQATVKEYKGLCVKCYSSAKKLVASGATTWERLGEMGLAIVPKNNDPFLEQFHKENKT